jgi:predicted molibdopterin-dependent oxidoreductase YjgC
MRGRARFSCERFEQSPEHGVAGYPYTLNTGRVLHQYNVGTMTRRTRQQELAPEDLLEIHPHDAAREAIADGSLVELESRWGRTRVRARVTDRVATGTLFLPFHQPDSHTNRVVGPHVDPRSKCPQYKETAVRLRRASASGAGERG